MQFTSKTVHGRVYLAASIQLPAGRLEDRETQDCTCHCYNLGWPYRNLSWTQGKKRINENRQAAHEHRTGRVTAIIFCLVLSLFPSPFLFEAHRSCNHRGDWRITALLKWYPNRRFSNTHPEIPEHVIPHSLQESGIFAWDMEIWKLVAIICGYDFKLPQWCRESNHRLPALGAFIVIQ